MSEMTWDPMAELIYRRETNRQLMESQTRLLTRIAELQSTIERMAETAAEQSRVHVEMHNTIIALNETNSQLAGQLWRLENPE